MLGNLKNPPEPFGDIIRTHFRLKAKSIHRQLTQWLSTDDGRATSGDGAAHSQPATEAGTSSSGFKKDVDEMKQILKQLQAGTFPSHST